MSEKNVVTKSGFTSDKSIVEFSDHSSKSTSASDASTTMITLALASGENAVAESDFSSLSSYKSTAECTDYSSNPTSTVGASTTMVALALASEENVVANSESTS